MRTSMNEIKQAEDFLLGKLPSANALLFKANLFLDPMLRLNVAAQKKLYTLVRAYGRKKIKLEVESVREKIFADPEKISFRQKIAQLFPEH
jgi:hypothetical protein